MGAVTRTTIIPRVKVAPRTSEHVHSNGVQWCERCKDRPATVSFESLSGREQRPACTRCAGMVVIGMRDDGFGRFIYRLVAT